MFPSLQLATVCLILSRLFSAVLAVVVTQTARIALGEREGDVLLPDEEPVLPVLAEFVLEQAVKKKPHIRAGKNIFFIRTKNKSLAKKRGGNYPPSLLKQSTAACKYVIELLPILPSGVLGNI